MGTEADTEQAGKEAGAELPVSKLSTGRERFLACVVERSLGVGTRSAEDFIRHFSPSTIMEGLKNEAERRANILVLTTGTKQRIALKKSWESCAEDLQIALEEGETDADTVVTLLDLDDRVRFLNDEALWGFITETKFWMASPSREAEFSRAKAFMVFAIDRGLEDKLLTHQDVVEGITVDELAKRLPKPELGKIIERALTNSHGKAPFTEVDLLSAMPVSALVDYVPLTHLWDKVVLPKIAHAHRYEAAPETGDAAPAAKVETPAAKAEALANQAPAKKPAPAKPVEAEAAAGDDDLDDDEEPTALLKLGNAVEEDVEDVVEQGLEEFTEDDLSVAETPPAKPQAKAKGGGAPPPKKTAAKAKPADSSDGWSALDRKFDDRSGVKNPVAKAPPPKPKASAG